MIEMNAVAAGTELDAARDDRSIDPDRNGRIGQHVAAIFEVGGQYLID